MKYTFKVEGDDGERDSLQTYIDAVKTMCFVEEFENHLRSITKYSPEGWSDQTHQVVEEIRTKWYEIKNSWKD